jgi:hypothetical protein
LNAMKTIQSFFEGQCSVHPEFQHELAFCKPN